MFGSVLTPNLQLFNYVVEGFIVYMGFDYRIKEKLQNVVVVVD